MFCHILYLIISILNEAKNGRQFLLIVLILNFRRAKTQDRSILRQFFGVVLTLNVWHKSDKFSQRLGSSRYKRQRSVGVFDQLCGQFLDTKLSLRSVGVGQLMQQFLGFCLFALIWENERIICVFLEVSVRHCSQVFLPHARLMIEMLLKAEKFR